MEKTEFKIYGYRWVVLLVFMFVVAVNQLLWITFAPITGSAATYYGVSDLSIGHLSMSFMIVYIVVSIPASWTIDTYGIRVAVGIGAALTGIFGLLRGLLASDYTYVLIAQIGIAIGQPFILNAITSVAARWFPVEERATAAGTAIGLWLVFVVLYDLVLFGVLLIDEGQLIGQQFFSFLMLISPTDSYRILNLSMFEGVSEAAGIAGLASEAGMSSALLISVISLWVVAPLVTTLMVFQRREL